MRKLTSRATVLLDPGHVSNLLLNSRPRPHFIQSHSKVDRILVTVGGLCDPATSVVKQVAMLLCLHKGLEASTVVHTAVQQDSFERPVVAIERMVILLGVAELKHRE
eukprot:CAMPEP_0196722896 /NCGR_PEP_ID=MMETSP1091-20130531/5116_1 /TAXON_ID=302021 /ORGANISM="Rhodomonas sp., Strain CCMP768" /LENGTH=106 /DNA_ID=CAMNT_0042064689 /DNA_START=364 /DNA_END=684 /DNA_ORIENTATION=-